MRSADGAAGTTMWCFVSCAQCLVSSSILHLASHPENVMRVGVAWKVFAECALPNLKQGGAANPSPLSYQVLNIILTLDSILCLI